MQHYVSRQPPNHTEVQQTLADLGDKKKSFIGSKEWIGPPKHTQTAHSVARGATRGVTRGVIRGGAAAGAMEVGMVLQELLKVEYKILFVSSGAELATKGRELVEHFQTQVREQPALFCDAVFL